MALYIQYQNSSRFKSLLSQLEAYLTIPIKDFYDHYFNIDTADTQGLANWGRILNQPNNIVTTQFVGSFGFDNGVPPDPLATGYPQNWDNGNFGVESTNAVLTDSQYRVLLKLVYLTYTINNTVWSCTNVVNQYIQEQYNDPTLKCTVIESLMSFTYDFNFTLQPWEISIFETNQKLPKPAGIGYNVVWV